MDRVIEQLAAGVEVPAGWLGQSGGAGELVHLLSRTDHEYRPLTAAQLLAWAAPDLLAVALRRQLEQAYQELPKPMSTADRLAESAKLDRELRAVETAIADAFWQAVAAGLSPAVPPLDGGRLIGIE